jgi:hypothetical protein
MDALADDMSFILERVAPDAFDNLTAFSTQAEPCRIGRRRDQKRPFCGVTAVVDFCAHAHHDRNNINAGCTMVSMDDAVTLGQFFLLLLGVGVGVSHPLCLSSSSGILFLSTTFSEIVLHLTTDSFFSRF